MSRGAWALCIAALLLVIVGPWAASKARQQREAMQRHAWCVHDWQELAPQYCQIDNTTRPGAGNIN